MSHWFLPLFRFKCCYTTLGQHLLTLFGLQSTRGNKLTCLERLSSCRLAAAARCCRIQTKTTSESFWWSAVPRILFVWHCGGFDVPRLVGTYCELDWGGWLSSFRRVQQCQVVWSCSSALISRWANEESGMMEAFASSVGGLESLIYKKFVFQTEIVAQINKEKCLF